MTAIHNILRNHACHSRPGGGKMMTTQYLGTICGASEAGMEWTEQRIEMLRRLWGQGQTASQIAVALGGVTRNAVIGKAHRLGLTGRPSPIKRDANGNV